MKNIFNYSIQTVVCQRFAGNRPNGLSTTTTTTKKQAWLLDKILRPSSMEFNIFERNNNRAHRILEGTSAKNRKK